MCTSINSKQIKLIALKDNSTVAGHYLLRMLKNKILNEKTVESEITVKQHKIS
jgi:hypothetical protein